MRDDSAGILFQSFLQEAILSSSGMGMAVHFLMLSIQHFSDDHSISYKDHVTNEEVRAKIQQAIGPHEDLLAIVKRRKLQWYGHVSRSSGLSKTSCKAQ